MRAGLESGRTAQEGMRAGPSAGNCAFKPGEPLKPKLRLADGVNPAT